MVIDTEFDRSSGGLELLWLGASGSAVVERLENVGSHFIEVKRFFLSQKNRPGLPIPSKGFRHLPNSIQLDNRMRFSVLHRLIIPPSLPRREIYKIVIIFDERCRTEAEKVGIRRVMTERICLHARKRDLP